jgi:hypothetical protein
MGSNGQRRVNFRRFLAKRERLAIVETAQQSLFG